jgi:hypothetical protein
LGIEWAIGAIAGLTAIAGIVVAAVMYETLARAPAARLTTTPALPDEPASAG